MKKLFFIALSVIVFLPYQSIAQTLETNIPFKYETAPSDSVKSLVEEYNRLEPAVLADIDWLNYNYIDENHDLRNEKSHFVLMWMTGSPTVSIQIDDRVVTFRKAHPSVMLAYMMGWTKYSLEHNHSNDTLECTYAAVTNAVNFYSRNRQYLKKNKELDKYKEMADNNTLYRHIADVLTR